MDNLPGAINKYKGFPCQSDLYSVKAFSYLVHLEESPSGSGFGQGHPAVLVAIGDKEDLTDQASEVGLLP